MNSDMENELKNNNYIIRRAEKTGDAEKLKVFFDEIFFPEKVGTLAEVFFNSLPGSAPRYWFMAEEKTTGKLASALTLIPWTWQFEDIELKVAEMGIVGTAEGHRKKGIQHLLHSEFNKTIESESYDISAIQGIPGFYHHFGYFYSIPLDNHINLGFHKISDIPEDTSFIIRKATEGDISFLMGEDEEYRKNSCLSVVRSRKNWEYLFSHSPGTEYGSDFLIIEEKATKEAWYFRISLEGFGEGLIISEVSEGITCGAFNSRLKYCRDLAVRRKKPYLRFNIPEKSSAAGLAVSAGALPESSYAWQVKIPDAHRFLDKIKPILERRIGHSPFRNYSGPFKIDLYREGVCLNFKRGKIVSVERATGETPKTLSLPGDLFPPLCFGYRTWRELQHCRPDLMIADSETGSMAEVLFPKTNSWIHCQY